MTRRDKTVVLALLALLVLASAGAIVAEEGVSPTVAAFGGTYVEGVAGVPQSLNPITAVTAVDLDVARLAFSGLTRYDREGAIVPDLASSFRTEADGRVWIFELRADATWHDGTSVTAADVVYTVGLLQDPAYAGPYAEAFHGVAVERLGATTVRFTLPDVYGPFADSTTVPLLPAHVLGGVAFVDLTRQPFDLRPIGTGPFRVVEVDGRQITLSRHEAFYRTKPDRTRAYLDRIVIRFYRDTSEALAALARGEVDGVGGLNTVDAERARSLRAVSLYSVPTSDFTALFLNVRPEKPYFRDRAVRQAIATAIDRGRVLRVAIDGRGAVADQFAPRTSWAHVDEIHRYTHSVGDAKALLDGAGWIDRDGDGVRDKGGVALRMTLTTSDEPARVAAAQQIVQDLEAVGIRVEPRTVSFDELVFGIARERAFDMLLVGIKSGNDPDPYSFFHSTQSRDPGYNFSGYFTLPIDRALEAGRRTYDQAARRELYGPVFQQIALESPVVFLYFSDYLYAQHRTVRGLKIAPISDPTQRFWDVEDWYVRVLPRRG